MTPIQVSPTTVKKTTPAATEAAKKKNNLNSDLVRKFCRYLRAATACNNAKTPEQKSTPFSTLVRVNWWLNFIQVQSLAKINKLQKAMGLNSAKVRGDNNL